MDALPISEIYINSDMMLPFQDDSTCSWSEDSNPSKTTTNTNNESETKANIQHSQDSENHNTNGDITFKSSDLDSSLQSPNSNNLCSASSVASIPCATTSITSSIINNNYIIRTPCKSHLSSFYQSSEFFKTTSNSTNTTQEDNIPKDNCNVKKTTNEAKVSKRKRGDPLLCWRCHKRDATPHMRSCEPCRVADRQRWSRRRTLAKFISENSSHNLNGTEDLKISRNMDTINNANICLLQFPLCKLDNQKHSRTPESFISTNTDLTYSTSSSPVTGMSLTCPSKIGRWHEQKHCTTFYRDAQITNNYMEEVAHHLSYITISYFPSPYSGLTSFPVSAKFVSDGSMNGLETLPSAVLAFIVEKCSEQLTQRQAIRNSTQHYVNQTNNFLQSQLDSGVANLLVNKVETPKSTLRTNNLQHYNTCQSHFGSFHYGSACDTNKFYY
ncbi:uncharacterized protein CMU_037120 [Cryptosporidium muris RN66]|uniref:Uncharacterized protein n=1 Tax=Cryptosporidium muris (strain RN66) TaxID=441375 RepID=B6AH47_CRYMR|nr:uncharacterized protein CMU_037120 [Cryptosporidium muris RN66]EEA07538.1 hypothetical protein, conserved [Cryptosporidium muris RN66]|eukprot:XP_002141887.1 hypothetical protein [Cryptosporidium muris RN66]